MRLPSLSAIIASQAVLWCLAGVWIHGWMILVYPLAWLAVLSPFLIHHVTSKGHAGQLGKPAWEQSVETESKQAVA